jgi:photoactive yellow protein
MDFFEYNGVDMAMILPRIPKELMNGLPFGMVKLDAKGTVIEYNMAEGDLTGIDPKWAIGKNFFDEVALCTKTAGFYGRFVEGVQKGFLNTVFDYVFDHRSESVKVRVQMVLIPDHHGKKQVIVMVKRANKPRVEQVSGPQTHRSNVEQNTTPTAQMNQEQNAYEHQPVTQYSDAQLSSALEQLQQEYNARTGNAASQARHVAATPAAASAPKATASPAAPAQPEARKKHVDIFSF